MVQEIRLLAVFRTNFSFCKIAQFFETASDFILINH